MPVKAPSLDVRKEKEAPSTSSASTSAIADSPSAAHPLLPTISEEQQDKKQQQSQRSVVDALNLAGTVPAALGVKTERGM